MASPAAPRFTPVQRAIRWARRMAFLVHRWLGIALALLMFVWAASGIVMMYVAFPETTREERLAGLEPLDLAACCDKAILPAGVSFDTASVEMLAGKPVLRWAGSGGTGLVSLSERVWPEVDEQAATAIAMTHMRQTHGVTPEVTVEPTEQDQWTVAGGFARHMPLYKASFSDAARTTLYISGTTGEVVQDTTRYERFWNWLGAVPHWLYFTGLRSNPTLWNDIVVYASLLGVFLTLTGIYVGIRMYGRGKHRSPYRGIALWHHWTGLIFGVLTLTWVASGLFSMQPWGFLESEGSGAKIAALEGRSPTHEEVESLFRSLAAATPSGVVSAELAMQGGNAYAILSQADGSRVRASLPALQPQPIGRTEMERRAQAAMPDTPIRALTLLEKPDAYYYGHHNEVVLPAWRAVFADESATRLYFDPRTGEMVSSVDGNQRAFRWLHLGLHRLDFGFLRQRPIWDIIVVPLMIGVTLLCFFGLWMGIRRLTR